MSYENTGGQNSAPIADGVKVLAKEAVSTMQDIKMAMATQAEIQVPAALPNLKQNTEKDLTLIQYGR